jgi:hypothetical protein
MQLKGIKSKDSEELSDSMYEHLSKLFVFLSSLLASVTVGWFAFLMLYKCWLYFGILKPHAEGLSLGVLLVFPIFYSIYKSKLNESEIPPKTQFKKISIQLFCVFLVLTFVLNLDLLVPIFQGFHDFLRLLISPTI